MNLVVGSGPAGVAAAMALLDAGRPVLMIDSGLEIEPHRKVHVEALAASRPGSWPEESVAAVKEGFKADRSGVPMKHVFGSDFPFRVPSSALALTQEGTRALRSFAQGGLSQAWGSTLLPFHASDLEGWPIGLGELAPHYRAVLGFVPLSSVSDGLDRLFPTYGAAGQDLRPSRQAASLLRDLETHRGRLAAAGIEFGRARLAVDASRCVHCGLCLYGCPYGCIYNSQQTLTELRRRPGFTYAGGVVVQRVSEDADGVRVAGRVEAEGRQEEFSGKRVYVAAGAISTAQILAASLGLTSPVTVQTSQAFLAPVLRYRAERNVHLDPAHTLAQVYLLLRDAGIARHQVQIQVYTYSDLIPTVLAGSALGPLFRAVPPLSRAVADRLVVLQGLLHSRDSDPMTLTPLPETGGNPRFRLEGAVSPETRERVRRVVRRLVGLRSALRGLVVSPLLKLSLPGQSFHSGGSFPMGGGAGPLASDLLGRPAGLRRIHAVDASVFPTIPAPPLTLTSMANAHRIAGVSHE